MQARDGIVDAIGNTPLIVLKRASAATRCTILGKAEFMNPGQSVKDRPARQIILEAEKRGEIKPGGLVVEATAGNTGIGLALVANARGYRTLIVIPETQSQEKKDMLRLCGAELVEVPAVASTTSPPGLISPRFSASRMIWRAGRSFTDWPGFMNSALPRMVHRVAAEARLSSIKGVLPMASTIPCLVFICEAVRVGKGSEPR